MSQIDDLYNEMSEEEIATYSAGINQAERHIVVNADRSVTVPDELKRIAVQYDHDVETVTFDCPRYWDSLDMSKMAVYVNYLLPGGVKGSYPCKGIRVMSDPNIMHFDWTISRNVTPAKGQIRFLVCVKKTNSEGNLVNHWNSELCEDCYISEGLEADADVLNEYPDIITQMLLKMDEITDKIPDVDDYLTVYSTNPVQNKVIAENVLDFRKKFVDLRNQYWEAGTIGGIYSDSDIIEEMTAAGGALWIKNKIWRLTFDPTGQFGMYSNIELYGHDVIGIPYNEQGLYIIDMTTGKSYKWEVTDGWTNLTHDISGKLNFTHVANDEEAKTALDTDGIIYVDGGAKMAYTIIQNRSPYGEKIQHKFVFGRYNGTRDSGMYWRSYNHNQDAWTEWASCVDAELNTESESPVMNKTVARAIYGINEQFGNIGAKIINGEIKSIVLIGDSITDGYGGTGYNGSASTTEFSTNSAGYCWANAFKKLIETRYGIPVVNKGIWGSYVNYQTEQALTVITENDFVIWLSGTNNRMDFMNYEDNLVNYIRSIKAKSAGMLFISNIPSSEEDEKAKSPYTMRSIDEVAAKSARINNVPFLSLYKEYIKYCETHSVEIENTFYDMVHPNDTGYLIMFKILCEKLCIPLSPYVDYSVQGDWWSAVSTILDTGYGETGTGLEMASGTIPIFIMSGYNPTDKTTVLSGKKIRRIEFSGEDFQAGRLLLVCGKLANIGTGTGALDGNRKCYCDIPTNGVLDFGEDGFFIPENMTLGFGQVVATLPTTAKLCYATGATSDNWCITASTWKSFTSETAPEIRLVAKIYYTE